MSDPDFDVSAEETDNAPLTDSVSQSQEDDDTEGRDEGSGEAPGGDVDA